MSRPSDYTVELAEFICDRIAEGESLRAICKSEGMPDKTTVLRWLRHQDEFRTQYARAREQQTEDFLEEITEIADDDSGDTISTEKGEIGNPVAVSRAKLRVDTLKWRMAKQAPKKYGDKLDITSDGEKVAPQFYILPDGSRVEF